MRTAVFPGSFDPVTRGHADLIERAAKLCDRLIVAVMVNPDKQSAFSAEERLEMLKKSLPAMPNVEFHSFSGLLADFARGQGAGCIIRGLRGAGDLEYETAMAWANNRLGDGLETLFLSSRPELSALSSSLVRQIARFGGDISPYVPSPAVDEIRRRFYNMDTGISKGGKTDAKE